MSRALSPSRAADFMQCPLLYRFRVVDKLPEPPSLAAARGTLVHEVLEQLFDLPAGERTSQAACSMVPGRWAAMVEDEPDLAILVREPGPGETDAATPSTDEAQASEAQDAIGLEAFFAEAHTLIERWFTLEDPTRLEPAERELYVETEIDGLTLRGYV
ncbi:MAG: PD-(D/E)XK nuclease family protein, partial [Ornithinimicrobium sp.]